MEYPTHRHLLNRLNLLRSQCINVFTYAHHA
jgi:hypothetical protein